MSGPGNRVRKLGRTVASRGVDLRLGEEQRARQVGAAQIGVPQVRTDQVRLPEVSISEVGADQVSTAQVGLGQIRATQACADEIRAAAFLLLALLATDEPAGPQEQLVDDGSFGRHVDGGEVRRTTHALHPADRRTDVLALVVLANFGEVPEQLVQLPEDRQRREHLLPGLVPPALPGAARNLLPGAETVVNRAARETLGAQRAVDRAAEGRAQARAGFAGGLIDREARRLAERQRAAAEAEGATAVGAQVSSGRQ